METFAGFGRKVYFSFFNPLRSKREIVILCAQTTAVLPLPTPPIISQAPPHRGSGDFLWFRSLAQIGLFSSILATLPHHSWEALLSLLYLSLTLPVNWDPETPKQSQQSLCRPGGAASKCEREIALFRFDEGTPFLGICVQLFKAAARSLATTTGFTVVHHWGFLYIAKVTVTMQLEGILKEALCRINYCINV